MVYHMTLDSFSWGDLEGVPGFELLRRISICSFATFVITDMASMIKKLLFFGSVQVSCS